jgi:hypothetical protein
MTTVKTTIPPYSITASKKMVNPVPVFLVIVCSDCRDFSRKKVKSPHPFHSDPVIVKKIGSEEIMGKLF